MTLPEIARQAAALAEGRNENVGERVAVAVLQEVKKEFNGALPYDTTVRAVIDCLITEFSPSTPEAQK